MLKPKLLKSADQYSPKMTLLHLRWQQIRLELLQSTLTPSRPATANEKKVLYSDQ